MVQLVVDSRFYTNEGFRAGERDHSSHEEYRGEQNNNDFGFGGSGEILPPPDLGLPGPFAESGRE